LQKRCILCRWWLQDTNIFLYLFCCFAPQYTIKANRDDRCSNYTAKSRIIYINEHFKTISFENQKGYKEQMPQNRYTKPLYQFSLGQTINSSVEFLSNGCNDSIWFHFEPNDEEAYLVESDRKIEWNLTFLSKEYHQEI
jgi:hypothetical protein